MMSGWNPMDPFVPLEILGYTGGWDYPRYMTP